MPGTEVTWSGSLHDTFRLLPAPSQALDTFLNSDGLTQDQVLAKLPYDVARSGGASSAREGPDPKRYRDRRQVFSTVGLVYEKDGALRVTKLGHAVRRWLGQLTEKNKRVLAEHAAYALSACQLRYQPGGQKYAPEMQVFPFAFIWRAMLELDRRISSDELNRGVFKVKNESDLKATIDAIKVARGAGDVTLLGPEVVTGKAKNDRIIPWMSLASFGWLLFPDKRGGATGEHYELDDVMARILFQALQIKHKHRDFENFPEYIEAVSRSAGLPEDVR